MIRLNYESVIIGDLFCHTNGSEYFVYCDADILGAIVFLKDSRSVLNYDREEISVDTQIYISYDNISTFNNHRF